MTGALSLAARVERIGPSASLAATARSRELRAAGRDILDLTVGEPDFDTPPHVVEAAISALHRGETRYTSVNGTPELRAAIIGHLRRRLDTEYTDAEIVLGGGAKQVIFLALMATLDAGDEVIIPAPYWVSYPDMVLANDGRPVIVPCGADDGFKLTPTALEEAITDRTRWLILNAPSNPTGAVYSVDELRGLAEVLMRHRDVLVLTDDIYDEIYFDDTAMSHLVTLEPALRDRVVVVNGVSKAYAMTGWRLGYGAGPAPLVAAMNKLVSQMFSCPSSISQAAAVAALNGDQAFVTENVQTYRARRDRAVELLNAIPGITCAVPSGAFYLFVGCEGMIGRTAPDGTRLDDDEACALYLLESVGVASVHGAAYGLSPYIRLSYATSMDVLEQACDRIAQACADLR